MTEELSLADTAVETPDEPSLADAVAPTEVIEIDVEKDAASFDVGEWADGVRPIRRAVRVLLDNHADEALIELQKLFDELQRMQDDDPEVDPILDRCIELQEIIRGQWVIIEAHGPERVRADGLRLIDELGVEKADPDKDQSEAEVRKVVEDNRVLLAHMCALQIVEPKLSGDDLVRLDQARRSEMDKIVQIVASINAHGAAGDPVMSVDFSRLRSARQSTD